MAQQIANSLTRLRQEILDELEDLPPEEIVAGMESQAERDRDRI